MRQRGSLALGLLLCGVSPALAAEAINPVVSPSAEGSRVVCATPCAARSGYITTGAVGGYLMSFNATSAPADGALAGASAPRECVVAPANSTVSFSFGEQSEPYDVGMTIVFSTTGCFTKTASATAFFKIRKQ